MSDIVHQTGATSNTPSIASAATILAANSARIGWSIQNLGTAVIFVRLGAAASTTVFHFALKAGTGNDDGLGGSISQMEGVVYTGVITVASAGTIRYCALEIAP